MDDLERRIRAAAPSTTHGATPGASRVRSAVEAGGKKRRSRLQLTGVAVVAAVALLLVPIALSSSEDRPTTVVASPSASATSTTATTDATNTTAPAATSLPAGPATVPPTESRSTPTTLRAGPATTAKPATPATTVPAQPTHPSVGPGTWVIGLDGRELRQLSTSYSPAPSWSPTGDRVAMLEGGALVKVGVAPPHTRQVLATGSDTRPACMEWSSKGELGWVNPNGEVFVAADSDNSGTRIGTGALPSVESGTFTVAECRWSPDGSTLAVAAPTQLTLIRRDGSPMDKWTTGARHPGPYGTSTVEWSPDGSRIGLLRAPAGASDAALFVFETRGPAPAEPTFRAPANTSGVQHLSWRQPGSREIFVQVGLDSSSSQHLVDVVAGTSIQLANPGCCQRLDALRDGRLLAFMPSAEHGMRKVLGVVDAALSSSIRIVEGAGPDPNGAVMSECRGTYLLDKRASPDGLRVVFTAGASYGPRCDSPVF